VPGASEDWLSYTEARPGASEVWLSYKEARARRVISSAELLRTIE